MKLEIKSVYGSLLYSGEATSLKEFLTNAVRDNANLSGAVLGGAKLSDATTLETGETWKQYLSEVVPALLTAGGKTIQQIVDAGAWKCHEWTNCPMAEAFSVHQMEDCPILLRPRVNQFIQYFDALLIPQPEVKSVGDAA